jgi:hypothetical protein
MIKTSISLSCLILFCFGCGTHNAPDTAHPNWKSPEIFESWVDQNGTFYPNNWESKFGKPNRHGAYSLRALAKDSEYLQPEIEQAEIKTKRAFSDFLRDKERLFVLIHGFNNNEREAKLAYKKIEQQIAFTPSDGVLEFYWDGLVSKLPLKIWFNATGYSQLAGTKGLRKLLNLAEEKEIIFIVHSRGASVLLSALSDPPYRPSFAKDTACYHDVRVDENIRLRNGSNDMKALVLAPAIGLIDFKTPNYYNKDDSFRSFDRQLTKFYHTVNPQDPVLRKYVGIAGYFNPTDLGFNIETAKELHRHDGRFTHEVWLDLDKHGFEDYVESPTFGRMLQKLGVKLRPLYEVD